MRRGAPRAGSVLALAILVLMALQLLAHGALILARSERAATLAGLRLLQARAGADAGTVEAERASTGEWDSVALFGETAPVTGSLGGEHPFRGSARRLSREYWLLEGRGRSSSANWGVTARLLSWRLDPAGRLAAVVGGVEVVGSASGGHLVSADPEAPPFCLAWSAVLDSVVAPELWGRVGRAVRSDLGEPSLGRLGPEDLESALPSVAATVGTPAPAAHLGRCDRSGDWNWGDPAHPGAPCGDHLVGRAAPGSLRLEGGAGQGVLSVRGDLDLSATRFDGVVLVGGSLLLRDGGELRGLVRVGGDLEVREGGRILGSPCRALRALTAVQSLLARPVRVTDVGVMDEGGWE